MEEQNIQSQDLEDFFTILLSRGHPTRLKVTKNPDTTIIITLQPTTNHPKCKWMMKSGFQVGTTANIDTTSSTQTDSLTISLPMSVPSLFLNLYLHCPWNSSMFHTNTSSHLHGRFAI